MEFEQIVYLDGVSDYVVIFCSKYLDFIYYFSF